MSISTMATGVVFWPGAGFNEVQSVGHEDSPAALVVRLTAAERQVFGRTGPRPKVKSWGSL